MKHGQLIEVTSKVPEGGPEVSVSLLVIIQNPKTNAYQVLDLDGSLFDPNETFASTQEIRDALQKAGGVEDYRILDHPTTSRCNVELNGDESRLILRGLLEPEKNPLAWKDAPTAMQVIKKINDINVNQPPKES